MQRPDDFFQTFKDKDLFYHLGSNLPAYKIWYDYEAPKGYFEVLAPRIFCSLTAIITNSEGESRVIFPWYTGKKLRKKINDLLASCPEKLHTFASETLADPEDYPVSP